jgi:hypothetical protein
MGWPRCSLGPPRLDLVSFEEGHHDHQRDKEIGGSCIRHRKGPNFATSSQKAVPPMVVGASTNLFYGHFDLQQCMFALTYDKVNTYLRYFCKVVIVI